MVPQQMGEVPTETAAKLVAQVINFGVFTRTHWNNVPSPVLRQRTFVNC